MIKTELFEHQKEVFEIAKDKTHYALLLEMGLGKTLTTLAIIDYHKQRQGGSVAALVVCPATLVDNWVEEVVKHSDLSYIRVVGSPKMKKKRIDDEADIHIINYEGTRKLYKELKEKKFDVLVLDESTRVKNFKSLQSRACYDISTSIPRKYILTGTPVTNSPMDIFAQYKVLDPLIFGISFYRFRARYAVMGGWNNKQYVQWRNLDDLKRRVYTCAVRKTKDECLDLPDKLYQVERIDLTEEQKEIYKRLKDDFIYEFKDVVVTAPIVLTRLMRFSQITAGFTKDVEGIEHGFKKNPKIDWLTDFILGLESNRKVVVFVRFRYEIRMVEEMLRKSKIGFVSLHGGTKERIAEVRKFNEDKDVRIFIGQIQTAGIGINLTSAHYCVFLSNSYSYGDRIQAEDRCHRIGQDNNVTYIDLLARDTIDEKMHKVLRKKESLANMVVGDLVKLV